MPAQSPPSIKTPQSDEKQPARRDFSATKVGGLGQMSLRLLFRNTGPHPESSHALLPSDGKLAEQRATFLRSSKCKARGCDLHDRCLGRSASDARRDCRQAKASLVCCTSSAERAPPCAREASHLEGRKMNDPLCADRHTGLEGSAKSPLAAETNGSCYSETSSVQGLYGYNRLLNHVFGQ